MARTKLTDALVSKLPKATARTYHWDTEVPRLAVLVQPSGTRSWIVQVSQDNRTTRIRLGAPPVMTVKDARKKAMEALGTSGGIGVAKVNKGAPTTFLEASTAYLKDRLDGKVSQRGVTLMMARDVPAWLATKPLSEVTMVDLRTLHEDTGRSGRTGIANTLASVVRAVMSYSAEMRWIQASPFAGHSVQKFPKMRGKKALSRETYAKLFTALHDLQATEDRIHWYALEALCLTGGRREEILSLRWDEVNVATSSITKAHHKTSRSAGTKVIPVVPEFLDLLDRVKAWRTRFLEEHAHEVTVVQRISASPWVFPSPARKASDTGYLASVHVESHKVFREILGLDGFVVHNLRSAFINAAISSGGDIAVVARMVGHADPATTMKHYREVEETEMARGIATVSGFFAGVSGVASETPPKTSV